ncbi:MAG: hypothetical protein GWM98_03685 [Nitrospinaceae bacterium]|nr:hypothetical protein [Nitrospinaceae bacterium]NIR53770.1 hypothetical protein [Nitrospinaceae bacterium]NIS84180.1 hypothetical protein [Nitrospinaceae bacterium]NIT80986.1 hypothetical protein [Nitrospinaceae bacterium]NIU43276.1 hypothetical protein [Nitrospinaceae bacterium]
MSRSVSKAGDCRRLCEGHSGCRAFTWVRREFTGDRRPVCRLKNRIPSKRSHPCCVSGIVRPVN